MYMKTDLEVSPQGSIESSSENSERRNLMSHYNNMVCEAWWICTWNLFLSNI